MSTFQTQINPRDKNFQANAKAMLAQVQDFKDKLAKIQQGGEDKAREIHKEHGKLLPRQRLQLLIDEGSEFLELSALAGYELYETDLAAGGLITGVGRIMGIECMLIIN